MTCLPSQASDSNEIFERSPSQSPEDLGNGCFFVMGSPAMTSIRAEIAKIAAVDVPVFLHGESGVGKEVIARLIHKLSPRSQRTFLKVNCAALPADLLESELFGYEAGAFTGATRPKSGKFELCNHGTILLDEIGEMPTDLQAKLLQVLQDRQFSRLGGRSVLSVDVRILAATNIDVEQALAAKQFRNDLYYRLSAFPVHIPPLRERKEDIPLLLEQLMHRWATRLGPSPKTLPQFIVDACMQYYWPGNVRELENFVKRFVVLGNEQAALMELRGKNGNGNGNGHASNDLVAYHASRRPSIAHFSDLKAVVRNIKADVEKEAIREALERAQGNRREAAQMLNISGKTLLNKCRQYGIRDLPEQTPATVCEYGTQVPSVV